MFLYKLKKILKEKFIEILKGSGFLAFIASFVPFSTFLFLHIDNLSFREKKQMIFVSLFCQVINLFFIYIVDYVFNYNVICSIFIGSSLSFLFFLIPCLVIMLWFEIGELKLDKDEIRDAKLSSLFRKLF
jgi:hypothetical protein